MLALWDEKRQIIITCGIWRSYLGRGCEWNNNVSLLNPGFLVSGKAISFIPKAYVFKVFCISLLREKLNDQKCFVETVLPLSACLAFYCFICEFCWYRKVSSHCPTWFYTSIGAFHVCMHRIHAFDGSVMWGFYASCERAHFLFFILVKVCLLQHMLMAISMISMLGWRVVLKLGIWEEVWVPNLFFSYSEPFALR